MHFRRVMLGYRNYAPLASFESATISLIPVAGESEPKCINFRPAEAWSPVRNGGVWATSEPIIGGGELLGPQLEMAMCLRSS